MSFTDKYYHTTKLHKSYVCLGLDTDMDQMPKFLLDYQNPIWEFNRQIIGSTKNLVAAYKLNFAFYLANGLAGIDALSKTITAIPDYIPVILDVKVGDIANTMKHYGKAFFDLMKVDSITVNPLMGEDVITPLLPYKDKFFFVLALTSNRSATDFLKHRNLYKDISKKIERWGHKQIGAVVGATNSAQLKEVRSLMPETIFLIPGIGAQGGNIYEVMANAPVTADDPRILINSSRGIIYHDKTDNFAEGAAVAADELRTTINALLAP